MAPGGSDHRPGHAADAGARAERERGRHRHRHPGHRGAGPGAADRRAGRRAGPPPGADRRWGDRDRRGGGVRARPELLRSSCWPGRCRASTGRWTPVRWRPGTSTPRTRWTPAPGGAALSRAGTVLGLAIAVGALGFRWPGGLGPVAGSARCCCRSGRPRRQRGPPGADDRPGPGDPAGRAGTRWRRVVGSLRSVPRTVGVGVGLLRTAPVLRGVVLVEVFWSVAMIAFETFNQVRLAELVGGEERAGVIIGPVSAVSWGCSPSGPRWAGWPAGGSAWPGPRCSPGCSTGRSSS